MQNSFESYKNLVSSIFPDLKYEIPQIIDKSGLTNKVLLFQFPFKKMIFRKFSNFLSLFVDRDEENSVISILSKNNLYPNLYYFDKNQRLEEFINGNQLSPDEFKNIEILKKILFKLTLFNELFSINISNNGCKLEILFKKLEKIKEEIDKIKKNKILDQIFEKIFLETFQTKLKKLYYIFLDKSIKCFCHNDLNNGNILIENNNVTIIDFEFNGFNPLAYEFANMFNEMACIYEPDFYFNENDYPSYELRNKIYSIYFSLCNENIEIKNKSNEQYIVLNEEFCKNMEDNVKVASIFSHYFWMIVAGLSLKISLKIDLTKYIVFRFEIIKQLLEKYKNYF